MLTCERCHMAPEALVADAGGHLLCFGCHEIESQQRAFNESLASWLPKTNPSGAAATFYGVDATPIDFSKGKWEAPTIEQIFEAYEAWLHREKERDPVSLPPVIVPQAVFNEWVKRGWITADGGIPKCQNTQEP